MSTSLSGAEAAAAANQVPKPEPPSRVTETNPIQEPLERKAETDGGVKQETETITPEAIQEAIDRNGDLQFGGNSIHFKYDDEAHRVIITVTDPESDEVIRQIPPEDYLNFVSRFRELFGLMLDETA